MAGIPQADTMQVTRHSCHKSYRGYVDATAVLAGSVARNLEARRDEVEYVKIHFAELWIEAMIRHGMAPNSIRGFLNGPSLNAG